MRWTEGALDEDSRAVADVAVERPRRELGETQLVQSVIHGRHEVGTRVDHRTVQIED